MNDIKAEKVLPQERIECGFEKAKAMGYEVVIVEGNPMNYRKPWFCDLSTFWHYRPQIRRTACSGVLDGEGIDSRRLGGYAGRSELRRLREP